MRRVHLHGVLKEKYGGPFDLEVPSPRQAVSLLSANFKGFEKDIRAGHFRIVRGNLDTGMVLDEHCLDMRLGSADLHIEPVIAGASSTGKGVGKVIVGALLVATAVVNPFGAFSAGGFFSGIGAGAFGTSFSGISISAANIGMFGVAMALSGVGQLISPTPQGAVDPHQSFLFGPIQNNVNQGGAIPLVYGQIRVGATMLSGMVQTDEYLIPTPGYQVQK